MRQKVARVATRVVDSCETCGNCNYFFNFSYFSKDGPLIHKFVKKMLILQFFVKTMLI